jgi:hypothetical protein
MISIKRFMDRDTLFVTINLLVKSFLILVLPSFGAFYLDAGTAISWVLFVNFVSLATLFDLGLSAIVSRHVTHAVSTGSDFSTITRVARNIYLLIAIIAAPIFYGLSVYAEIEEGVLLLLPAMLAPIYIAFNYRFATLMGLQEVGYANKVQALCGGSAYLLAMLLLVANLELMAGVLVFVGLSLPSFIFKRKLLQLGYVKQGLENSETKSRIIGDSVKAAIGVGSSLLVYNFMSYYYSNTFSGSSLIMPILLLFQLLRGGASFAQAPFYSKIPLINMYYARGQHKECLVYASKRAAYVVGLQVMFSAALFLTLFLFKKESIQGLELFYLAISVALVFERIAAMMMQVYTASGIVIWHKVNGAAGIFQVLFCFLLVGNLGYLVFPMALFSACTLFQIPLLYYLISCKFRKVAEL